MSGLEALVPGMRDICGAGNVITDPLELRTYECDGLTGYRVVPALVALPGSVEEPGRIGVVGSIGEISESGSRAT